MKKLIGGVGAIALALITLFSSPLTATATTPLNDVVPDCSTMTAVIVDGELSATVQVTVAEGVEGGVAFVSQLGAGPVGDPFIFDGAGTYPVSVSVPDFEGNVGDELSLYGTWNEYENVQLCSVLITGQTVSPPLNFTCPSASEVDVSLPGTLSVAGQLTGVQSSVSALSVTIDVAVANGGYQETFPLSGTGTVPFTAVIAGMPAATAVAPAVIVTYSVDGVVQDPIICQYAADYTIVGAVGNSGGSNPGTGGKVTPPAAGTDGFDLYNATQTAMATSLIAGSGVLLLLAIIVTMIARSKRDA